MAVPPAPAVCPPAREELPERPTLLARYLTNARSGDVEGATQVAMGLLDAGFPFAEIVVNLLAAAQEEIGRRVYRAEWTVSEEHTATAATQASLDALSMTIHHPSPQGLVVVACAEGNWHALAAQMLAEILQSAGVAVSFLGGSTPAVHVADLLDRLRPDAVAVSATLSYGFSGVVSIVDAAHQRGVPVLAGGRGLGPGPSWALRLGADGWSPDGPGIVAALDRGTLRAGTGSLGDLDPVARDVDRRAHELASDVLAARPAGAAALEATSREPAALREQLAASIRSVADAAFLADLSPLAAHWTWLFGLRAARGAPSAEMARAIERLVARLEHDAPDLADLAASGLEVFAASSAPT